MSQLRKDNPVSSTLKYAAGVVVLIVCWLVGSPGALAHEGGIGSSYAVERQLIKLHRDDWQTARRKRCRDDRRFWRHVDEIPTDRLLPVRMWTRRHVRAVRLSSDPRPLCYRSHVWAESWAGRCVSSREGGLRTVSTPSGTWHGKWQMNADFERAYGPRFLRRWGRASHWPEWAQDYAAYRGYLAGGWWKWPNTAAACGLL
jgi:hypothetical protein